MDGESLRGLVSSCLSTELQRYGARFPPHRFEELHEHLVLVALEVTARYDPKRSRPGYKFESLIWDVVAKRLIDWWRKELADPRQRPEMVKARRLFTLPLALDALTDRDVPAVEDGPLEDDLDEAAAALAENLSPEGAWRLSTIATALAEGAGSRRLLPRQASPRTSRRGGSRSCGRSSRR